MESRKRESGIEREREWEKNGSKSEREVFEEPPAGERLFRQSSPWEIAQLSGNLLDEPIQLSSEPMLRSCDPTILSRRCLCPNLSSPPRSLARLYFDPGRGVVVTNALNWLWFNNRGRGGRQIAVKTMHSCICPIERECARALRSARLRTIKTVARHTDDTPEETKVLLLWPFYWFIPISVAFFVDLFAALNWSRDSWQ